MNSAVVIVFAKAPRPGEVKTRLAPPLDAEGAAALHVKLVRHTLDMVRDASCRSVRLCCAPDEDDPFFRFCAAHYGVALRRQAAGNLGERMHDALRDALATHARALLIGTDCPALTARHLQQADSALCDGADAVFVPCEDGGYALIGLTRIDGRLFDGITWATGGVMEETRARLKNIGWTWCELETLWDVDRPEDYRRLVASGLLARGEAQR